MTNVRDFREDLDFDFWRLAKYTRGLECLDNKFAKPDHGDLVILLWYPSMWKTEFSLFLANQNVKRWNRVAYLSLELTKKDLVQRVARKSAGVSYQDFQNAKYSNRQIQVMKKTLESYKEKEKLRIVWAHQEPTLEQLEILIRECNDKWFQMIVIDNLGKIEGCATDLESQAKVTSKLQSLKNELSLCIICLHHLKKPKGWDIMKPWWASAFSGSQKIKDNCSIMVELRRDLDPYEERLEKKAEVALLQYKQTRDWITGIQKIYFNSWEYWEEYKPQIDNLEIE